MKKNKLWRITLQSTIMGELRNNIPEGNIVYKQNTVRRVSSNFSQGQGDVYSGYKRVSQVVANLF